MTLPHLLKLVVTGAMAVPATGLAQTRTACELLSADEAASLMGAPLPEPFKSETLPEMHNGHDHATACGWFPKGYNPATADAPPERGILLTLQVAGQVQVWRKDGPAGDAATAAAGRVVARL